MIDLLNKTRWDYAMPWGNVTSNNKVAFTEELVKWENDGSVKLYVSEWALYDAWRMNENWERVPLLTNWGMGFIVAKELFRTHYGHYRFKFKLPNFRGSWPAIWLIDLHPPAPRSDGMGMPPEIDIMEHFRKDCFLTRFHTTHTFHQGPTYENNKEDIAVYRDWVPVDREEIEMDFIWNPYYMIWYVGKKRIMHLTSDTPNFPRKPMNLVINAGVNPDWKPQTKKFEPFIVTRAEYYPLNIETK